MRVALLLAVLAACGPATNDGPDGGGGGGGLGGNTGTQLDIYKSGSRIKMNVLTTSDGAKAFQGWHDTQLDVDCNFYAADDGTTRCLPWSLFGAGDTYFTNATCTQPAAVVACSGNVTGQFVTVSKTSTSCPATTRYSVFKATGTTTSVFVKTSSGCTATTLNPTVTAITLGTALPASMFAEGTASAE